MLNFSRIIFVILFITLPLSFFSPSSRIGERLPPGRNAPSHPHHPVNPAMQHLSQSLPTSQPPGSYMQPRASMPPGTLQPGYRIPTPGEYFNNYSMAFFLFLKI